MWKILDYDLKPEKKVDMQNLNIDAVNALIRDVEEAWNRGDLESICESYALDASYVSESGCVCGKENIFRAYLEAYPDASSMGHLSLKRSELRFSRTLLSRGKITMASAIFRWKLQAQDGSKRSGWSLLVFGLRDGEIRVIQDASISI